MMEPETAITLVAHCGHIVIVVVSSEHEDYVNRTATTQWTWQCSYNILSNYSLQTRVQPALSTFLAH